MAKYLVMLAALTLGACGHSPTNEELGTAGGAAIGGVVGHAASGGSTLGTIGGAAVGGVVGNQIGRRHDDH